MLDEKKAIRKEALAKRNALQSDEIIAAGISVLKDILPLEQYQKAETLMLYMDFRNEVPTGPLIAHAISVGKKLVLPLTDENFNIVPYEVLPEAGSIEKSLKISSFGIFEPNPEICREADPKSIDMVIVPGVAFDWKGNRLGYGRGCYDRFLPLLRQEAFKLGLAHQVQLVQSLPADPSDIPMDGVTIV